MAPSGKNVIWVGGGHWCDIWFFRPSIAGCGQIFLFLFGNRSPPWDWELWLAFLWDPDESLFLSLAALFPSTFSS